MAERKSLSKRVRFEVLKRDGFKCVYCGATAPDVQLHIDHVDPVSKGGSDDFLNLVTSCQACNLGKGNRKLSEHQELEKSMTEIEILTSKDGDLDKLRAKQSSAENIMRLEIDEVSRQFSIRTGYGLSDSGKRTARKWLRKDSIEAVVSAIDAAETSYADCLQDDDAFDIMMDKVPAILGHRRVYGPRSEAFRRLSYAAGILRHRHANEELLNWNEDQFYDSASDMLWAVSVDTANALSLDLIEKAKSTENFPDLDSAILHATEAYREKPDAD